MNFRLHFPIIARLLLALGAPVLLTQCALLANAVGLLTTPLRMVQGLTGGLVMEDSATSAGPMTEEQWRQRAREVEKRGDFRGQGFPGRGAAVTEQVAFSKGISR